MLCFCLLLAPPPEPPAPTKSNQVVSVKLERGSLADGIENFFLTLNVHKGWHVFGRKQPGNTPKQLPLQIEFFADGKKITLLGVFDPKSAKKSGPGGKLLNAHGTSPFTCNLIWRQTENAKIIGVRVRVTASNGKTTLKPSFLKAEIE